MNKYLDEHHTRKRQSALRDFILKMAKQHQIITPEFIYDRFRLTYASDIPKQSVQYCFNRMLATGRISKTGFKHYRHPSRPGEQLLPGYVKPKRTPDQKRKAERRAWHRAQKARPWTPEQRQAERREWALAKAPLAPKITWTQEQRRAERAAWARAKRPAVNPFD